MCNTKSSNSYIISGFEHYGFNNKSEFRWRDNKKKNTTAHSPKENTYNILSVYDKIGSV